jgi:hypothetical protein
MDLLVISSLAFIAGITVWLLCVIETLENNKPKKKKEVKVSLFDDSFNSICSLINNKISTTYFPPFSENNVRVPIEYKLSNKITMLSDEEEHNLLERLKKEYIEREIRVCNDYDPVTHFPININYVTIIDVEFANNFKGPYTAVILKFK